MVLARDLGLLEDVALVACEPVGLPLDDVDDALEPRLGADGDLERRAVDLELISSLLDDLPWVGACTVKLVDKYGAGDPVAPHLAIDGDALALDAANRAEDKNCAVEDAECALNLNSEIYVSRRVDNIDLSVFPLGVGSCRLDRNSLFAFQIHVVHLRTNSIFSADLVYVVNPSSVVKYALCQRSFPRIDVRRNPNVPDVLED